MSTDWTAIRRRIDVKHNLAEQVWHRRQEQGLDQVQLASRAKITVGELAEIEAGHTDPALSTVAALAYALDVEPAELLVARTREGSEA